MIYYNSSPCLHYSDTDASPAQLNTTLCSFIITTTGREEARGGDIQIVYQNYRVPRQILDTTTQHTARTITITIITVIILLYYYYLSQTFIYTNKKLISISDLQETKVNVGNMESCHIPVYIAKLVDNLLSPTKRNCGRYLPQFISLSCPSGNSGNGS